MNPKPLQEYIETNSIIECDIHKWNNIGHSSILIYPRDQSIGSLYDEEEIFIEIPISELEEFIENLREYAKC